MYESPIRARILAIDPGNRSGWAWFTPNEHFSPGWDVLAGSCDAWGGVPREVVAGAVAPDAIVIESPGGGATGRFLTMVMNLSATVGIWRWLWRNEGPGGPELDVVQISWRAGLLGGNAGAYTSADWKRVSIEQVQGLVNWPGSPIKMRTDGPLVGIDSEMADAVNMGWWALHSPLLADALGPMRLKRLGWDDRAACLAAKGIRTNERSTR